MSSTTSPNQKGGGKVGLRSRLDFYRIVSDTCHVYLLVENRYVLSLLRRYILRRLATSHTSLRIAWVIQQEIGDHLVFCIQDQHTKLFMIEIHHLRHDQVCRILWCDD